MKYRIKLIGYNIYIWLVKKVIWVHDVIFTCIDNAQLKLWIKQKDYLTKLKTDRLRLKRDYLQKTGIDSWD